MQPEIDIAARSCHQLYQRALIKNEMTGEHRALIVREKPGSTKAK